MVFDFLETAAKRPARCLSRRPRADGSRGRLCLSSGRVAWSPRDAVSLTRSGFTSNPVGFRVRQADCRSRGVLALAAGRRRRHRYEVHPAS